jgi:hypothetical protein
MMKLPITLAITNFNTKGTPLQWDGEIHVARGYFNDER